MLPLRLLQNRARRYSRLSDARAVDRLEPKGEERLGSLTNGLPSDIWDRYLRLPGGESTGFAKPTTPTLGGFVPLLVLNKAASPNPRTATVTAATAIRELHIDGDATALLPT